MKKMYDDLYIATYILQYVTLYGLEPRSNLHQSFKDAIYLWPLIIQKQGKTFGGSKVIDKDTDEHRQPKREKRF